MNRPARRTRLNRPPRKRGYRQFHPVTSPLVILRFGLVGFWIAFYIALVAQRYFRVQKLTGTPTAPTQTPA